MDVPWVNRAKTLAKEKIAKNKTTVQIKGGKLRNRVKKNGVEGKDRDEDKGERQMETIAIDSKNTLKQEGKVRKGKEKDEEG